MTGATNLAGDVVVPSKATLSSAPHKHQRCAQTKRGIARGVLSAHVPAAYEPQACELGRGDVSPVLSRIPHRLGFLLPSRRPVRCPSRCIGHHLRARAVTGCASLFHSVRSAGCTRPRAQSLAHKQVIQAVAYGPHLSRLSSSVFLRWFQPIGKAFDKWTKTASRSVNK